jgi:hypothetical protein
MAKMGHGEVNETRTVARPIAMPVTAGVVLTSTHVEVKIVLIGAAANVPIMRDGFVTETGFLSSPMLGGSRQSTCLLEQ